MLVFINVSELCAIPIEERSRSIHRRFYYGFVGSTVVMWQLHMTSAHDPGVEPLDFDAQDSFLYCMLLSSFDSFLASHFIFE